MFLLWGYLRSPISNVFFDGLLRLVLDVTLRVLNPVIEGEPVLLSFDELERHLLGECTRCVLDVRGVNAADLEARSQLEGAQVEGVFLPWREHLVFLYDLEGIQADHCPLVQGEALHWHLD